MPRSFPLLAVTASSSSSCAAAAAAATWCFFVVFRFFRASCHCIDWEEYCCLDVLSSAVGVVLITFIYFVYFDNYVYIYMVIYTKCVCIYICIVVRVPRFHVHSCCTPASLSSCRCFIRSI